MLGTLAIGTTRIEGCLKARTFYARRTPCRRWGRRSKIGRRRLVGDGRRRRRVGGTGRRHRYGQCETGARLMMGVLAGHDAAAFMTGDVSLRSRPMEQCLCRYARWARILARDGGRLPLAVVGASDHADQYRLPVPSTGEVGRIVGRTQRRARRACSSGATRDHTEQMMRHFGATVRMKLTRRACAG